MNANSIIRLAACVRRGVGAALVKRFESTQG